MNRNIFPTLTVTAKTKKSFRTIITLMQRHYFLFFFFFLQMKTFTVKQHNSFGMMYMSYTSIRLFCCCFFGLLFRNFVLHLHTISPILTAWNTSIIVIMLNVSLAQLAYGIKRTSSWSKTTNYYNRIDWRDFQKKKKFNVFIDKIGGFLLFICSSFDVVEVVCIFAHAFVANGIYLLMWKKSSQTTKKATTHTNEWNRAPISYHYHWFNNIKRKLCDFVSILYNVMLQTSAQMRGCVCVEQGHLTIEVVCVWFRTFKTL